MTTKRTKNSENSFNWMNWLRLVQFIIFFVSCIAAVIIWYYAQTEQREENLEAKYVTKIELKLLEQKLDSLEDAVEDLDDNFTGKLEELEETNTEIVGLITDIRLTLAKLPE